MVAHQSLAGQIKGLRYVVRLNDFKLAQRLRMALAVALRHLDGPVRDDVARLVDVSGLWVRIADIPPVGPAEPVNTPEARRVMLAADRASARIAKWGQPREPDPRPVAWWPEDFVEGGQ
jgi:hypothetical protein